MKVSVKSLDNIKVERSLTSSDGHFQASSRALMSCTAWSTGSWQNAAPAIHKTKDVRK